MANTFPGPYVNQVKLDEGLMKTTTFDKMGVGARSSGLPKDVKNTNTLEHVGGSGGKR